MDTYDFPREAAENPAETVTLGGLSVPFREPVKLKADVLLAGWRKIVLPMLPQVAAIQAITEDLPDVEAKKTAIQSSPRALAASNALAMEAMRMLDWLVEALGLTAKQRGQVESECGAQDVVAAFMQVGTRLQRPFGGGGQSTARPTAETIPSESGDSETPSCSDGQESAGTTQSPTGQTAS